MEAFTESTIATKESGQMNVMPQELVVDALKRLLVQTDLDARHGSIVLSGAGVYTVESGRWWKALVVVEEDSALTSITGNIENATGYAGIALPRGFEILGVITAINLQGGVIHAYYGYERP